LTVGLLLVCAVEWRLSFLTEPELAIQLVASDSGERLAVHLVNVSEREVRIALADVDCFWVRVPNTAHEYVVHVRAKSNVGGRKGGEVVLSKGDEIVLADVSRRMRMLLSGDALLLSAVFAAGITRKGEGVWSGFVRSAPLLMRSL
jgi:hypothetical protein